MRLSNVTFPAYQIVRLFRFPTLLLLMFCCLSLWSKAESHELQTTLCGLKTFHKTTSDQLLAKQLLSSRSVGTEYRLSSNLFHFNFGNYDANFNPDRYAENIWLATLWVIATEMAVRSGEIEEFRKDEQYNDVVQLLVEHLSNVSTLLEPKDASKYVTIRDELGRKLRDALVDVGAFKSHHATFQSAYGRLSAFLTGLGIALATSGALTERQKAELMAQSIVSWVYLEKYVVPFIKHSPLFMSKSGSFIPRAVEKYTRAPDAYQSIAIDQLIGDLTVIAASALISIKLVDTAAGSIATALGLGPGLPTAVVGVALGIIAGVTIDLTKQGAEFVLYHDIASRLFTVAFSTRTAIFMDDMEVYIASLALYMALNIMKEHVIGKGAVSLAARHIPFVETEEKKWDEFFRSNFEPMAVEASNHITRATQKINQFHGQTVSCRYNYYIFLIDVSDSMNEYGKLQEVKKAVPQIVKSLQTQNDVFALIVYSGSYGCSAESIPVVVPFTRDSGTLLSAVEGLNASGNTPMRAGLEKAYLYARFIPEESSGMIILLADGQQNCPDGNIPPLNSIIIRYLDIGSRPKVTLSTIAYGMSPEYQSVLKELAHQGGGVFIDAQDPKAIKGKFREAILSRTKASEKSISAGVYAGALLAFLLIALLL